MTGLTAGILSGAAFWILTHLWCHRRYLAMEAGDLEELGGEPPSAGLSAALEKGIELQTVSPRAARLARDRGVLSECVTQKALSGSYRRRYDRTLAAELPWLPVYLGMSTVGALVSPASSLLLSAITSAAQCDSRFRVIPTVLAIALVPMGLAALPPATEPQAGVKVVAAAGTFAIAALTGVIAKRKGARFGAGDLFLITWPVSALAGDTALAIFLASLTAELAIRAYWGRCTAAAADIPLAVYMVAPTAIAFFAYLFT